MPIRVKQDVLSSFRRKFMGTNMLFVIVVLVAVVLIVMFASFQQRETDVYNALEARVNVALQREGMQPGSFNPGFPGGPGGEGQPAPAFPDDDVSPDDADDADDDDRDDAWDALDLDDLIAIGKPERPSQGRDAGNDMFVATSLYQLDGSGNARVIEDSIGLDDDSLSSALAEAQAGLAEADEARGRIAGLNLYYVAKCGDEQVSHVSFASSNYVDSSLRSLALTLGIAGTIALLAFLAISWALARWAVRPVERAWTQQQQFIADASHELKTPLTVIMANDSILAAHQHDTVASQMQWIESTETEAKLMQGLVNDMLYLAQMEGEQREHVRERVDLSELVEGSALTFAAVAFERGVMIEDEEEPGLEVLGDAARLGRLVGTLIDNACKYAPAGEEVRVTLTRAGHMARLQVHNAGNPIDPQDLPHLFDRFYRADKARTSGKGGFGLGLSIAKSIAEDHGGTIACTSSEATGTTFTVELPLA